MIPVPQVRKGEQEVDLRPITPSKIPVGAWRAEEERAITRALNGSMDSNRQSGGERSVSPAPPSRIPKFSNLGPKYRAVQVRNAQYLCHYPQGQDTKFSKLGPKYRAVHLRSTQSRRHHPPGYHCFPS